MKIEVLVRWTEVKRQSNDEETKLKKLLNGDESKGQPEIYYDYSPMVLDIDDIARFNRGSSPDITTLRFKDGEGCVIKCPYKAFVDIYMECTGKTILSALPKDYTDGGEDLNTTDPDSFDLDDEDEYDDDF
jgi:hypothetical protein